MKKKNLALVSLMVGFLLVAINLFAADGDLIVNGNVGIGTTTPGAKLDIQGGSVKVGGVFLTHVTGPNQGCPAGKGVFLMRKFVAKTCTDDCQGTCSIAGGWSTDSGTCQYGCGLVSGYCYYTCTCQADWTEAICMGN